MLEFIVVESGSFYPNCCIACNGYKGPLADLHVETHSGRVYVCRSCAKRLAIVFGFTKGEQMEKLTRAAERLELGEKQMDEALCRIADMESDQTQLLGELRALQDYRAFAEGRIAQLEALISEDAKTRLQVANG